MLKKITFIASLAIFLNGYSQWTSQTSGTTQDLKGVSFPSSSIGYTVGAGGTVLKTTNGGTSWVNLNTSIIQDLYTVIFIDDNVGLVFGDGGRIYKTTNGGSTWTQKTSGTSNAFLTCYLFNNNTTIFAAGASGTIKRSLDAGETWSNVVSGTTEDINAISFDETTNTTGFFVGNNAVVSYIYKSVDAGLNWSPQTLPAGNVNSFFSISMVDANNIFFCGGVSKILKTNDSGANWTNINNTTANFYRSCLFSSANEGYIVGGNGKIIYTSNAGSSYTPEASGTSSILNDITNDPCGSYYIVGNGGVILKKGNGSGVSITASGSTSLCQGQSVVLQSSSSVGNTWSTNETTASISVSTAGTYFVTVTNGACSGTSNSIVVTVTNTPSTPTITASGSTTFCEGENVVLTSSASTGNSWTGGSTAQSITVTTAGSYTVNVTENGCVSASSSPIVITVNPLPTPTISSISDVCSNGNPFTLNQGSPAGGSYAVNGVVMTTFTPSTSNVGSNTVVYGVMENGCIGTTSTTFSVLNCVAIDEVNKTLVQLNPNPTVGMIEIKGIDNNEINAIEVYDHIGKMILTEKQTKQIDLSEFSNGSYLIIIKTKTFESHQKVQVIK